MDDAKRKLIADALVGIVDKARNGGPVQRIGLMAAGSELGSKEILQGGRLAQAENKSIRVVAIGPRVAGFEDLEWIETAECEADIVTAIEKAVKSGDVDGAVAMHYPFPIGVATIGRALTPGRGKPMFIASCTGNTATSRSESLLRNALYGIATAKASGIPEPTVALLNIDGAGPVLRALTRMQEKGYSITFGSSERSDGGALLRGNDLIAGTVDVLVCDTLTGNVLIKMFSTFTSGGQYESVGWGYGPSTGEGWSNIISIISRASGAPVIANALNLTARVAASKLATKVAEELSAAKASGLSEILEELKPKSVPATTQVPQPTTVPVDAQIAGVDVLDMEVAVQTLWKENIYAEAAMGCTGPVVRVQEAVKDKASKILKEAGFI